MIMILKPEHNANIWSIKLFSSTAHFEVVTPKHAKLFHYAPPPLNRKTIYDRWIHQSEIVVFITAIGNPSFVFIVVGRW